MYVPTCTTHALEEKLTHALAETRASAKAKELAEAQCSRTCNPVLFDGTYILEYSLDFQLAKHLLSKRVTRCPIHSNRS